MGTTTGDTAGGSEAGTDWVLVPDVDALAGVVEDAADLLLTLVSTEEEFAEDPNPWVLPAPITGRDAALAAMDRIVEALRGALDELTLPPIEEGVSTRPRLLTGGYEHLPFRAVPIATADRELLAAAAAQLELALTPAKRRGAANPWDSKRLSDLAELLEQIADNEPKPTTAADLIQSVTRLSHLLNLPHNDDTALLLDALQTSTGTNGAADVQLTPAQSTAYGRTATTFNKILTGGNPLDRWMY